MGLDNVSKNHTVMKLSVQWRNKLGGATIGQLNLQMCEGEKKRLKSE